MSVRRSASPTSSVTRRPIRFGRRVEQVLLQQPHHLGAPGVGEDSLGHRTDVGYSYVGDVEGTGRLTYLIAYRDGAAPVLGFEHFEGSIGGREGTCVLQHIGEQDKESVSVRVTVVPGMGTGGLADLRGEAELSIAGHSDDGYGLALSYELG